jgi:putative transposase
MSVFVSAGTGQPYGLTLVCRTWGLARSTAYWRRQRRSSDRFNLPRGPAGPCPDNELVEEIKAVLKESPFHGEGYRKVWARLRLKGIRTSKRRTLRLMREHGLLAPHRVGRRHGPKGHDGTIVTDRVDEMWGTDMTSGWTNQEGQAAVFVAVDHCSAECVGIHASKRADRFQALEPIRQGVRVHFGAFDKGIVTHGLKLRHDHGSQYMSDDFQDEIDFLGLESSPAFVREPEGNGCAERFIRTLKENLLWVSSFNTVEELRQALHEFKERYNNQWLIGRHGNKTPAQVQRLQTASARQAA